MANKKPKTTDDDGEPAAKRVLLHPLLASLIFAFLQPDRKECCHVLPLVCRGMLQGGAEDAVWRALFERDWPKQWVAAAETAVEAAGGVGWKAQYKLRHDMTVDRFVDEIDGNLSLTRGAGCSVEGWKDGSWSIFEGENLRGR